MMRQVAVRIHLPAAVIAMLAVWMSSAPAAQAAVTCPTPLVPSTAAAFHNPTTISNAYLPLVPGAQSILDGTINTDAGETVEHQVTWTVTDVTKVLNGVR